MKPELLSDPGSVEDFCTTGRDPKKFHLSPPPPPPPSFPPIPATWLALHNSSGVLGKRPGLIGNQLLRDSSGEFRGLALGVTQGVTEGVPQGVTEGVDCADVNFSSLWSPLGIFNFFSSDCFFYSPVRSNLLFYPL